jgi:phage shock protein PspC (stress-responsive transcriptional regulator)
MNKTLTINISGIIFHIEEDAYDHLSKYLATIKGYFSNTDGGNEIMTDIEARIAELLQGRINASKQVILMADVEFVMSTMGKPEEFGAEQVKQENKEQYSDTEQRAERVKRRLFRNPDDKAIGGVCSGLAAYFDIDTVWIRLAMFLLIFFGGLSIWIYIILWIVMPQAKTTADKFAMRGEPVTINNIARSFKDEAEEIKTRYKNSNYGEAVRSNVSGVLNVVFNILGRLFGLFLVLIGGVFLFGYVASLVGISITAGNADVTMWRRAIFDSPSDYFLGVLAFIIVLGIPVLMLIYAGVKLLFKIRYSNRWLNLSLGLLWVIGIIIGFFVTVLTVKQFNENSKVKETVALRTTGDTLIVKMSEGSANLLSMGLENKDDVEYFVANNDGGYCFGEKDKKLSVVGYADLDVEPTDSDSAELIISRIARGSTRREAHENARAITYTYRLNKNELVFDEVFLTEVGSKFRAQELDIKIKLPKGKVIYFDKSVKALLDDVDNTTNTWDGHMISRRWKMTDKGLECIDCEGLDSHDWIDEHNFEYDHDPKHAKKEKITINENGIHVDGKNQEIRIDDEGIRIKTSGQEIEMGADTKKKATKAKHK